MNPDTGDIKNLEDFAKLFDNKKDKEITETDLADKANELGYTALFDIREVIQIKECFFVVNNFVSSHNFMNLKLISRKEAIDRLNKEE